jgi:sulfhydrogenase subunit beta (sulfur reductase)
MANKKIDKKNIPELLKKWSGEFSVFVPSLENNEAIMAEWDGKDVSFLDWYRNTVKPPKANFLPLMEKLFSFKKSKGKYQIEVPPADKSRQLIFGIRPCDARALAILDMTFKDAYEDPYYLARRKNAVLVGMTCTDPYDSCFCTSLEGSPSDATNVDLMLTDIGDSFLTEAVTDKGKKLIASASGLKDTTGADEAKAAEVKEAAASKITRKVDTRDIDKKLLASFEDKEYWEKVAAKCISCGICTFLCPTCYCFDINDEMFKQQGARFRNWDSCAFPVYTKMPMENPREEKWHRIRQKVCHKYEFYPMNFGVIACTGCGRCIRLCPVNWDITQALNSLPVKV